MNKEIRVYGIDSNSMSNLSGHLIDDMSNADFMNEAENQGLIWDLAGFARDMNGEMLPYDVIIRFIIVETSEGPKNMPVNHEQDMRDFIYK